MAAVPEQVSFGSECLSETLGQELAVDLGPAHGQVMTLQVSRSGERLGIRTAGLMLGHIVSQDGFTQPARTAVDEHNQLLLAQAKLLELAGVENFLNSLEFGEVVSASERSESFVELRGLEFLFGENFADFVGPDVLEVERDLSPAVELHVPADQVGLEQRHTAADIPTDEVRIDEAFGYERRTDRAAFARVQIREADSQAHTLQLGGCIQLAESLAFNPALGRSEKAHIGLSQSVHASFRAREADWAEVGLCLLTPHSAVKWSPRLVSRQRLLLFREALICLSYSGVRSCARPYIGRPAQVTLRVFRLSAGCSAFELQDGNRLERRTLATPLEVLLLISPGMPHCASCGSGFPCSS